MAEGFAASPAPDRRRVVLVDDHGLLARGLALALEAEGLATETITDPAEAVDAASAAPGCLALLDLQFAGSDLSGVALIEPLRAGGATVLVLTGVDDDAVLGGCLERGAVGVLRKSVPFDVLLDAVRRALAGDTVNSVREREDLLQASRARRLEEQRRRAPFERLSPRERDVLDHLTHGRAADGIAAATFVSVATIRTQIQAILRKLEVSSQLAAVALARESGWVGERSSSS